MVLNVQEKWVLVIHEEGYQQPAPSQYPEIVNLFLKMIQEVQG